jgi:hypothetical protein
MSRQAFEKTLQNDAAHHKVAVMHQKLAYLHSIVLEHLAYSPYLAPLEYCLFLNSKKRLKGRTFFSTVETTLAAVGWFAAQPKEFF